MNSSVGIIKVSVTERWPERARTWRALAAAAILHGLAIALALVVTPSPSPLPVAASPTSVLVNLVASPSVDASAPSSPDPFDTMEQRLSDGRPAERSPSPTPTVASTRLDDLFGETSQAPMEGNGKTTRSGGSADPYTLAASASPGTQTSQQFSAIQSQIDGCSRKAGSRGGPPLLVLIKLDTHGQLVERPRAAGAKMTDPQRQEAAINMVERCAPYHAGQVGTYQVAVR